MAFKVTAYATTRMIAHADHHSGSHWVNITVVTDESTGRETPCLTIFFDGNDAAAKADGYAAAINSVPFEQDNKSEDDWFADNEPVHAVMSGALS